MSGSTTEAACSTSGGQVKDPCSVNENLQSKGYFKIHFGNQVSLKRPGLVQESECEQIEGVSEQSMSSNDSVFCSENNAGLSPGTILFNCKKVSDTVVSDPQTSCLQADKNLNSGDGDGLDIVYSSGYFNCNFCGIYFDDKCAGMTVYHCKVCAENNGYDLCQDCYRKGKHKIHRNSFESGLLPGYFPYTGNRK